MRYMDLWDWGAALILFLISFPILWDVWLELNRGITLRQFIGW